MIDILFVIPAVTGRGVYHVFSVKFIVQIVVPAANSIDEYNSFSSERILVILRFFGESLKQYSVLFSSAQGAIF